MTATKCRLAVLASGAGTNLQAILDATASGRLAAQVVQIVSGRQTAPALERAHKLGIPALYFPFTPYKTRGRTRAAYDADLAERVAAVRPDLVVLAGWMRLLSPAFLDRFPGKVINLHPALPGAFPGLHAIERAYAAYRRGEIQESGCMVHYVTPEVDVGPLVAHAVVPFRPKESLAEFEARMHATEHHLIVEAIASLISAPPSP